MRKLLAAIIFVLGTRCQPTNDLATPPTPASFRSFLIAQHTDTGLAITAHARPGDLESIIPLPAAGRVDLLFYEHELSALGIESGNVVEAVESAPHRKLPAPLVRVVRGATHDDDPWTEAAGLDESLERFRLAAHPDCSGAGGCRVGADVCRLPCPAPTEPAAPKQVEGTPAMPVRPNFAPCPPGWSETQELGATTCLPATQTASCAAGKQWLPDSTECLPLGTHCSTDGYNSDLAADQRTLFVSAAATTPRDGSRFLPFATINEAIAVALQTTGSTTIAVGNGDYVESLEVPAGISIVGNCAANTRVIAPPDTVTHVRLAGSGSALRNLTVVGGYNAVFVTAGVTATLSGLNVLSATVGFQLAEEASVVASSIDISDVTIGFSVPSSSLEARDLSSRTRCEMLGSDDGRVTIERFHVAKEGTCRRADGSGNVRFSSFSSTVSLRNGLIETERAPTFVVGLGRLGLDQVRLVQTGTPADAKVWILASFQTAVDLRRVAMVSVSEPAITMVAGKLALTDVVISGSSPEKHRSSIINLGGVQVEAERLLIDAPSEAAIFLNTTTWRGVDFRGRWEGSDVTIVSDAIASQVAQNGWIVFDSDLVVDRVAIDAQFPNAALVLLGSAIGTVSNFSFRGTIADATPVEVRVTLGADLTLRRGRFENAGVAIDRGSVDAWDTVTDRGTHQVGTGTLTMSRASWRDTFLSVAYSSANLTDVVVERSRVLVATESKLGARRLQLTASSITADESQVWAEDVSMSGRMSASAVGFMFSRADLRMTRFRVDMAGFGGISILNGNVNLSDGLIRRHIIGLELYDSSYDLGRVTDRVRYEENETAIGRLPPPD